MAAVVIAGGGPTGMMLAAELMLARDVDVVIVERRATQELAGARAGGLHARTIEVLDQRGVADRFVSEGKTTTSAGFAMNPLDLSDFPSRRNYTLGLFQNHIERILAHWVLDELKAPIMRGCDVVGFEQDEEGVDVELSGGRGPLRAQYLVGCDGGRSLVRKKAGIDFPGWDPSVSYLIAECNMTELPAIGVRGDAKGTYAMGPIDDGKRVRLVLREEEVKQGDEPTLDELRALLMTLYKTDFGVHNVTWLSRFTDMTRQAASYRSGRVLLAGDAAHIHGPQGGQGLNIGVQDAVNLGWKLAQVVKGISRSSVLDTYQAERHPIAARVLRLTMAQTALSRADDRILALRETMTDLFSTQEARKRYAGIMSGLEVHYDLGEGHPLVGRRIPDLDVMIAGKQERVRLFTLLHDARPLLLNFGKMKLVNDRVKRVDATYEGDWLLPVIGKVKSPSAVLVRPDGYVAWTSDSTSEAGLEEAIAKWF